MEVDGGEIVKFLQDTLDALFNIMMEMSDDETYDFLVKLSKVLNFYVAHADDSSKTELLFAALKALKYLFRFIIQSRVLYLR
ncbi:hypothetical protein Celaphus_00017121 [Cervus elaphus hippelaphus]|uniref:Dedicator of cytokinesis TPR repeats region domain-containing protein n=1 Tax=Cervus elaphus hippelaphus TaxID=46360 RepID=A0A212CMN1_CEREH|nr:hypothetical protein Celaphus_00017121 [Cervus elaphus hippelaphus]